MFTIILMKASFHFIYQKSNVRFAEIFRHDSDCCCKFANTNQNDIITANCTYWSEVPTPFPSLLERLCQCIKMSVH